MAKEEVSIGSVVAKEEVSIGFFEVVNVVIISALDDIIVEISLDIVSVTEVLSWEKFDRGVAVSFLVADVSVVMFSVEVELTV